ncbi:hypothetical protein OG21DRAFT_1479277 [Imleria badia]|nr:hypothetical protein OG21DRAFT_1479277 [Imleria badia]
MDTLTEYHPRSGRPPLFQSTEDFSRLDASAMKPDKHPCRPFKTHADLEFADIAIQAGLNVSHVNALLSIISRVANKSANFTKVDITVEYKKEPRSFEVHVRPLWDWALDLLNNPLIAPHFVWDAQHLHWYDGEEYQRFYTEPWTGDRWWDIQSCLPDVLNAVPFAFILYADKTWLSSHGTVKAYPVVARCANLPIDLRNSERFGGGCIVSWLPIVPEQAKDESKKTWTNFKRVIWHKSFMKLLEAMFQLSQTSYKHKCYDRIERCLFVLILILSADYEELCMMTLIHGTKGKCPCPVCLVPLKELCDLSKTFPMQTISQAIEGYEAYLKKKSQGEEILKQLGLWPVENVFWKVLNSEPEEAASFDRLHYLHSGLWGKHMLEELKIILKMLGWDASTKVEELLSDFPRWHDLAHFDTVLHITFSDGNKLRDLVKQVFYALLDILTQASSPVGYRLLRMLGTYLQLDSLIGLDVHTDKTLEMIEKELIVFGNELQQYIKAIKHSDNTDLKLDWDFPKAHLWKHVVQDIRLKGVVHNYSTHPNEKMHGALKDAYADRSNRKDIEKQILRVDHHRLAIKLLRGCMEAESEHQSVSVDEDTTEVSASVADQSASRLPGPAMPTCVYLGAPRPLSSTISEIEDMHHEDHMFGPTFKMHKHTYLKVDYASEVDWKWATDYLRCTPSFHGHPRYDCALVLLTEHSTAFVRLIFVFKCTILNSDFKFALVQPYMAGTGSQRRLDCDLKLTHVRAVPRSQPIFIPADLIIRGALLYPDPANHNNFIVVDHIDGDLFLRTMSMRETRS